MGLDMYLSAKRSYYQHDKENIINNKIRKAIPEMFLTDNINYVRVEFEAGYWRKANEIHSWFVRNVQEEKDDCGEYEVSREKLKELLELCKKVLSSCKLKEGLIRNGSTIKDGKEVPIVEPGKFIEDSTIAKKMLPTESGFFFGSTDYDEEYYDDLKRTVEIIEKCLALPEGWYFYYHSSW